MQKPSELRKPCVLPFNTSSSKAHGFFDASALKMLSNPKGWKFYSPFQPITGSTSAEARSFRAWAHKHKHAHPFYEIMLAIQGSTQLWVSDAVLTCQPGTMLVIAPNQAHARRYYPQDNDIKHLWFSFITPEQAFLQFVTITAGKVRWLHGERSLVSAEFLSNLLQVLRSTASERCSIKDTQIQLLLNALFALSGNLALDAIRRPASLIDREALVQEKITITRQHIRQVNGNTTIADLAQIAGYTPSHFARVFKRVTGQTVHQHIDACRLDHARVLLAARVPLKEIAPQLGFANKNTLSRWLSKYRSALEEPSACIRPKRKSVTS